MLSEGRLNKLRQNNIYDLRNHFSEADSIKSKLMYGAAVDKEVDLSIVIPAYNRTDVLMRAIRSSIGQNSHNIAYEVVICDNSTSSDTTNYIVTELNKIDDSRVRYYVNETNIGMFNNWNRCVYLAKGKYVAILHADDWLADNYISETMRILKKYNDIDWLSVRPMNKILSDIGEDKIYKVPFELTTIGGYFPIQCSVFKRDVFIEHGGFSTDSYIEDLVLKKTMSFYKQVYVYNRELYFQGSDEQSASFNVNWEDELIYEYYYDLCSVNIRKGLIKHILKAYLRKEIIGKVERYIDGDSYFNRAVRLDKKSFMEACQIKEGIHGFFDTVFRKIYGFDRRLAVRKMKRTGRTL